MSAPPKPIRAPALSGCEAVSHGFFTREGGVSEGLFASLNCGFGSADDAARVADNRARAAGVVGVDPAALVTAYQVHGVRVARVEAPWRPGEGPKADAMVTAAPGIALGILTADCAPVLFADPKAGVVGAAHAGWRGAKDGILEATVAALIELGARADSIVAGIGPCIAQDSYEVGPEFPAPFIDADAGTKAFFRPGARRGRFMFDLAGLVRRRLDRLGLARVDIVGGDTCAEADRFFSYRRATIRGEPDYGRNLSLIALGG